MNRSEHVSRYIDKSQEFAKPILEWIRTNVHKACPEVTETIKWGMPFFMYNGKILCYMASFKKHCAFGLKEAKVIEDVDQILEKSERTAMGNMGRITAIKDLPSAALLRKLVKAAAKLAQNPPIKKTVKKAPLKIVTPSDFMKALKQSPDALKVYNGFAPYNKKEYVEWIEGAKREATRASRITQSIALLMDGKTKNWKYR